MLTVIETPVFQSMVEAIWTPSEREDFAVFISEYPLAGDVIPQTGGLRKLRWSRQGMGKRGGARVIYTHGCQKVTSCWSRFTSKPSSTTYHLKF
jgi:hypothetical protein